VPRSVRTALRRLATSRFISMAGTDATGVAIGFALYAQTQSPRWLSLSLMLTVGAGALLAPLGGRAGDLVERRRLMIGCELAAFAVFVALAVVHTPAALLGLGLLATAIGTVFGPASGAAIAHVAGDEHLTKASGLIATATNVGKTAGRLAAGALIAALGVSAVFVLDALTFLISAWLISGVRRAFSAPLTVDRPPARTPTTGALRALRGDRTLRALTATACVSTFATAFTMTAEVPLAFEIGAGALGLGALTACWGAGMIGGSWLAARVLHRGNEATGVLAGRLAMAAGVGLVAAAPSLGPMLACYLLGGLGGGFMGVAAQAMTLRGVDDDVRPRLLAAIESCRNAAFGLGVVGAGIVVGLVGARPVYAAVGMTLALGTLPVAMLVMRLGGPRRLRPALSV
jgi:DHA3 family macrolide efflux protein-like MFS transporter